LTQCDMDDMFMVAVAYVMFRIMNIYKFETENKPQINGLETEK